MEIFYHGSSVLFDRFDLSHVLEGDGKVKFGYGVYLTSSFKSAAHYSGANKSATTHFVYTVEIPDLTEDNHINFKQPVHLDIVKRAEQKLGNAIPQKFTLDGKDFRKYLAKILGGGSDGVIAADAAVGINIATTSSSAVSKHLNGVVFLFIF